MAFSFWAGIVACYTIEWYLDVYGWPWKKRYSYIPTRMPFECTHLMTDYELDRIK